MSSDSPGDNTPAPADPGQHSTPPDTAGPSRRGSDADRARLSGPSTDSSHVHDSGAIDGASIWEPLDGSAPRYAVAEPRYEAPGGSIGGTQRPAPGGPRPAPHQVAAAYAASARAAGVFTLAAWWPRALAFVVDSLLFGIPLIAFTILAATSTGMTLDQATTFFASATIPGGIGHHAELYAVLVAGRLLLGILPAFFLVAWNGQTPGKRMVGLRVMRASGERMTFGVALRREVVGRVILVQVATIFTLGVAPFLNYLWPLWDRQRRAGHDLFADTRVVTAPAPRR